MLLKGKEYEQRLEAFSESTIRLIMGINRMNKELAIEKMQITADSELTEEQVVERLQRLLEEHKART